MPTILRTTASDHLADDLSTTFVLSQFFDVLTTMSPLICRRCVRYRELKSSSFNDTHQQTTNTFVQNSLIFYVLVTYVEVNL